MTIYRGVGGSGDSATGEDVFGDNSSITSLNGLSGAIQTPTYIKFAPNAYHTANQGELTWNTAEGTLDLGLNHGGVVLQIGQELHYRVTNQSGSNIPDGTLVSFVGTTGNSGKLLVEPYDGTQASKTIIGLTTETIINGENGYVTCFGKVRGIQTNGGNYSETWVDGDILYPRPTGLTNILPQAPAAKQAIAVVVHAHGSNGELFVRVQGHTSIEDDELVQLTSLTNGDVLQYDSTDGRFENRSLSSAGIQPILVSGTTIKTVDGNNILGSGNIDLLAPTDIGVTVQGYDVGLQSISGLVTAADKTIYTTASDTYAVTGLTSFGRSLIDDATASDARTTLGLGTLATQSGTFSGTSSGTNTGDQNLFSTVAVSGQSNIVADTTSDTITFVAGTNMSITTDAATDSITINDIATASTLNYTPSGSGAVTTTIATKLNENVSVNNFGVVNATNVAAAISAVQSAGGGTVHFSNNTGNGVAIPSSFPNVLLDYDGPNITGNVYSETDAASRVYKLLRSNDNGGATHQNKEGYTLAIESRPLGSGYGDVPSSDYGLGVSIVKKNWHSSTVQGQVCGVNLVTRGGYFNAPKFITAITQANPCVVTTSTAHGYINGDVVIIQNVLGMTQVNAAQKFTIANVTTTTFELVGINSTAYGAYTSGGIVQKDSGVASFYNPADTAAIITNTVQSSANGFSAILEGVSYFMPSGNFIGGSKGIRVQLGAIKQSENLAIGVLSIASNGSCGAAFQAQNSRANAGIEGSWNKFLSYLPDFGAGAYEAFSVNQLGNIILHGGTSATTPTKLIRANAANGSFEIVNDANSAVIFRVTDTGTVNIPTGAIYALNNIQVVGPRNTGWTAMTGTANENTSYATSTITLVQLAERVKAIQDALTTHGLIGT